MVEIERGERRPTLGKKDERGTYLMLTGGTMRTVGSRDTVTGIETTKVPALHRTLETLSDAV
jgi:hypothetical protein